MKIWNPSILINIIGTIVFGLSGALVGKLFVYLLNIDAFYSSFLIITGAIIGLVIGVKFPWIRVHIFWDKEIRWIPVRFHRHWQKLKFEIKIENLSNINPKGNTILSSLVLIILGYFFTVTYLPKTLSGEIGGFVLAGGLLPVPIIFVVIFFPILLILGFLMLVFGFYGFDISEEKR